MCGHLCAVVFSFPEVLKQFNWSDKSLHLWGYTLLGGLLVRLFKREFSSLSFWRIMLLALVAGTLYGVSDELHQALVPGRSADAWDVLADMVGTFLGTALFWRDLPLIDRRRPGTGH